MDADLASLDEVETRARASWRPPPRLTLSEWADANFYLSAESAAEPGRWRTLPYQRGMMDAITDPRVERVSVMKSARVGYTKCMNAAIGYFMHQDACSILVVQPTVDDAKGYSKEEIAPMLRDCPELARIAFEEAEEAGPKDSGNTILHKKFPGGVLSMVGANSGAGFRRISRRVVLFDEVDGYPPSAGSDGDQIKLGIARTQFFWNRKIIAGSTPLVSGASRIETMFLAGDQRRYYVPCPHCGHFDVLVFREEMPHGHFMRWDTGKPETAYFVCRKNGCIIEHKDKRAMVSAGEWRANAPFSGHASFHIWAAYSFSPNASWGQLATEFLEVKNNPETLKTFVNTVLGETWREQGEAPEWERLYNRRESYAIGAVPAGAKFLTCGVDVQKDRWVWEVVGWNGGKQSWSIDSGVIPGDTSNEADWSKLDELFLKHWESPRGLVMISALAVDAGYNTQQVYNWVRKYPVNKVMAVKGVHTAKTILSPPTPVDVTVKGKRVTRGCKVWPVGSSVAKAELYGWLRQTNTFAAGFCHFPEYGEEYFKQLTSEQLMRIVNKRTGFTTFEWQILPGRENHFLDARVYARAAATMLGIDRMRADPVEQVAETVDSAVSTAVTAPPAPKPAPQPRERAPKIRDSRFFGNRAKGWFR